MKCNSYLGKLLDLAPGSHTLFPILPDLIILFLYHEFCDSYFKAELSLHDPNPDHFPLIYAIISGGPIWLRAILSLGPMSLHITFLWFMPYFHWVRSDLEPAEGYLAFL